MAGPFERAVRAGENGAVGRGGPVGSQKGEDQGAVGEGVFSGSAIFAKAPSRKGAKEEEGKETSRRSVMSTLGQLPLRGKGRLPHNLPLSFFAPLRLCAFAKKT
jgi:hypothetical protein